MITQEDRKQIEERGYGITGDIGGIQKQLYYTPDGREVRSVPSLREWSQKDAKGNVTNGIRDANLDKGWSLQMPTGLKPYCSHCDKWHDTEKEIEQCGVRKKAFDAKYMRKAKKETGNGDEVAELRKEIAEFKDMVKQLLERDK